MYVQYNGLEWVCKGEGSTMAECGDDGDQSIVTESLCSSVTTTLTQREQPLKKGDTHGRPATLGIVAPPAVAAAKRATVPSVAGRLWVSTADAVARAVDRLSFNGCVHTLVVDIEAVSMDASKGRGVSVIQVMPTGPENNIAYVFDVHGLGPVEPGAPRSVVFETPGEHQTSTTLGTMLASPYVCKLMVDPRRDASMLYHLHGIRLANVVDLQVVHAVLQACHGLTAVGTRSPRQGMFTPTTGLLDVYTNVMCAPFNLRKRITAAETAGHRLYALSSGGDPEVWAERPLHPALYRYAALGVMYISRTMVGMRDAMALLRPEIQSTAWGVITELCSNQLERACRPGDLAAMDVMDVFLVAEFDVDALRPRRRHSGSSTPDEEGGQNTVPQ